MDGNGLSLISCKSGIPFGNKLFSEMEKLSLSPKKIKYKLTEFANSESLPELLDSVRGQHVFIVADCDNHSTGSVDENFSELELTVSTARSVGAQRISVIMPMLPYSRQDAQRGRQPHTCAVKLRQLEFVGQPVLREMFSYDLHNKAATGFPLSTPLIPLYASKAIIPKIQSEEDFEPKNSIFLGPDLGRGPLARYYAEQLMTDRGVIDKSRNYAVPNECEQFQLYGKVTGKDVFIIDDIIDTGGTIIGGAGLVKEYNPKSISIVHVHSLFNQKRDKDGNIVRDPVEDMKDMYEKGIIKRVIGTDTVYNGRVDLAKEEFYEEISLAPLCAQTCSMVYQGKSISHLLT